jgi:hypothetical protein
LTTDESGICMEIWLAIFDRRVAGNLVVFTLCLLRKNADKQTYGESRTMLHRATHGSLRGATRTRQRRVDERLQLFTMR